MHTARRPGRADRLGKQSVLSELAIAGDGHCETSIGTTHRVQQHIVVNHGTADRPIFQQLLNGSASTRMKILVPMKIDNITLLVEVAPTPGSERTSSHIDRARGAVTEAFERAQAAITAVATSTLSTITQLGHQGRRPSEVEIKFGLKFTAEGSVVVAGVSGESTLEIVLKYTKADLGAAMTETLDSEA
jgi:Trypsin-co-occurring domain 1